MSASVLIYGAKLVRDNRLSGSDMLSFIMCQLALGPILSVGDDRERLDAVDECHSIRTFRKSTLR